VSLDQEKLDVIPSPKFKTICSFVMMVLLLSPSKIWYKNYIALVCFGKTLKDSSGHDNTMRSYNSLIKVNPITQKARFVERFSKCNKTQKLQINTTFMQVGRL
jgi:hypothetical protein